MTLIDEKTGKAAQVGDVLTDFRGDTSTLTGMREPQHAGSSGRVFTDEGEFFPSVFGLKWVETSGRQSC